MSDRAQSRSVLGWSLLLGYGAGGVACWGFYIYVDYPILSILIFPAVGSVMTLLFSLCILLGGDFFRHIGAQGAVERPERQGGPHMRRL